MYTREFIQTMIIGKIVPASFIVMISALLLAGNAAAQVKFTTVISSKEIGRADYVQVEFVVENARQIENLVPPTFPNFRITEGPIQSSGMSIVNGNTSQYKGVSFVLQPLKTGKFTIEGATATVDGKPMHSNPVHIEVSASGPPAPASQPGQPTLPDEAAVSSREYILRPGENVAEKIKKNLFVRVQADKTSCYIGEPIVVTYKLYSRLRSESRVTKRPSLNGFSVYDMVDPNTDQESIETLNGKQFTVHIIRKSQLIPLQAGTVELDPAEVENKVFFIRQTGAARKHRNLLDELFDPSSSEEGTETDQNITLSSQPLTITIKPLPEENKPADFNGAVGQFTMQAAVENTKMAARDAATLKVTVSGTGNLPIVNAPPVKWPDSIEAYEATAKEDIDKTVAPMGGSKTFEYVFTPEHQGNYSLSPVSFSYFDPSSASYKTLESQPIALVVGPAPKQKKSLQEGNPPAQPEGFARFFQQHLEWFFAILILSGLGVYLWRQNTRLKKADTGIQAVAKDQPAQTLRSAELPVPEPADPLVRARRLLSEGDANGYYTELSQVCWDSLRQKLHLQSSELNKPFVVQRLRMKGWDDQHIDRLEKLLAECEMNLYTPDHNVGNMQQLLQHAETILRNLREA